MASQRWKRVLKGAVLVGAGLLGACVVTPAHGRRGYGYGGSGYSAGSMAEEHLDDARAQCMHVARDIRGYRGVRTGSAFATGPDTARVQLYVGDRYGRYELPCDYDARRGSAFVR